MNKSNKTDIFLSCLAVVVFFVLWEIAVASGMVARALLPAPSDVYRVAIEQLLSGELHIHIGHSMFRILVGFAIGASLGVALGATMGLNRMLNSICNPIVELLRPIPPLAWIPLAIVWFGIGDTSKVFLLAVTAFFPVVVNTYKGIRQINPTLFQAAQSLEMKRSALVYRIAIPSALPDIVTGFRVSWGLVFAVLVASEMIAAETGLGFLVSNAMNLGRFDVVMFGILLIGILSVATDYLWQLFANRKLLFWHQGMGAVEG